MLYSSALGRQPLISDKPNEDDETYSFRIFISFSTHFFRPNSKTHSVVAFVQHLLVFSETIAVFSLRTLFLPWTAKFLKILNFVFRFTQIYGI